MHLKRLLRYLNGANGRVLEVGCGAGRLIRSPKRLWPDSECYGCDTSFAGLKRAASYPEFLPYQEAGACALPYRDDSFAAIVVWDLIEHLASPEEAIRDFNRVLEPGGIFSAAVPCEVNRFTLHSLMKRARLAQLGYNLQGHVPRFTTESVLAMLHNAGFTRLSAWYSWHWVGQVADVWRDVLVGGMGVPLESIVSNKGWKVLLGRG